MTISPTLSLCVRLPVVLLILLLSAYQAAAQTPGLKESSDALYQGEYQQAAQLAAKYLRQFPGSAPARVLLARAELAQGHFPEALRELRQVLTADPRNIDAHYYLAIVARALAQQENQRLFAMAPDSHRVHQLLGESALAAENQAEAETEFKAALKTQPDSVEVLIQLGELKRSQSNFDEAIDYYLRAERAGGPDYDIAYGLGVCHTYKQNFQQAIEYLQKAVEMAPDSAAGKFALANALFQNNQTEAAIPLLQATVGLEPNFKQAYFLLGRAYQKLGRQNEAQAAFKKLAEVNAQERGTKVTEEATGTEAVKPPQQTPVKSPRRSVRRRP